MMPTLLSPSQVDTVESLTDRCDGCGAAAKLGVTLASGGELAFCGHHANRLAGTIASTAVRISLEEGFEWTGKLAA
jgi:hypothetical protein